MDIAMLFSPEERDRSIALWERHIRPSLGARECNQFVKATKKPSNWFVDTIIKPRLFLPQEDSGIYYPVDLTAFSEGRNHHFAERIAEEQDHIRAFGGDPFTGLTYFANPLRLDTPIWDEVRQTLQIAPPKDRVALGRHQVFTFEFDVDSIEFLKQQLSWLRSSGNWHDSRMGQLFAYCSGFADFVGITVNYSGNKSLHIHIVFDTELARQRLALGASAVMRNGLVAHWERLHPEVIRILGLPPGVNADRQLRFPESFRRLPNGSRVINKAGHILSFPVGTHVPQVTLWENWRQRASADDLPLFFCPEPFQPDPSAVKPRQIHNPTIRFGQNITAEEHAYCEDRLHEIYAGWPRFDHLNFEGGRWVAKFRNSPNDCNPSSMMREDFASIHLMGQGAAGLEPRRLPFPLGTMLRLWVGKARSAEDPTQPSCIQDVLFSPAQQRTLSPLEQDFRQGVVDGKTALNAMRSFLCQTVSRHPLLLIVGPEGLGKTSVLMELHHEFVTDLERRGESSLAMYAFADYEAAERKCSDFNRVQGENGFVGVLLPSFSRAYEDACSKLGIKPISVEEAARYRFPSRWAAIEKHQPAVTRELKDRHAAMWASVGKKRPVFFTVHQVAHHWKKSGNTRLMWAPSFWNGSMDDGDLKEVCRVETTLGLLVHDEVKIDSIVEMQPEAVCLWVDALVRSDPKIWNADRLDISRALASYEGQVSAHGYPKVDSQEWRVSFEEVVRLSHAPLASWDHIETANTGEYVQKAANDECSNDPDEADHCDIYAARHGRSWMIVSRNWWNDVAKNVVILTTEAVPTAVLGRADPSWSIFELETPNAPRDCVETYAARSVTGSNLLRVCSDWRDAHPDDNLFVVSNKVGMMTETMPHVTARGSNDLIGRNVLSTMTFMTPDEYERLQALNAWTGRSDLVGLRHIDEFNQTAGRNLGYRKQRDVKHVLLVNRRLFGLLMGGGEPLRRSRYDFRLHMDKNQRYDIKRAG